MSVLIVCPTGFLVHQYKSKLPDIDGIDNIRVDTIQGVLNYKRPGADSKVTWTPPSALKRIDLILMDEACQYADTEFLRFVQSVTEQPHRPFTGIVADFQQLQPIESGARTAAYCRQFETVELKTVYRTSDEQHLIFLNRIRVEQPERRHLTDYCGDRHWRNDTMEECVARGLKLQEERGHPFAWLTCTNKGSSEVCQAALRLQGIGAEQLAKGYPCDPTTQSPLNIIAKPGLIIRLSRNFDKQRGFVNGALAVICESLRGNEIFTAKLIGTGNMVLLHPYEERGEKFLPCCYGYATTIRRAQGADLVHGAIYFEQFKRPATRGYAYVACSRFKSRGGCYLFGKMRRSDFLPVGADKDTEQLERGDESEDSGASDYSGGLEHVGGFENALRENDSESEDSGASDYSGGLEHSGGFERALRENDTDCLSGRDDGPDEGTIHADFLPL